MHKFVTVVTSMMRFRLIAILPFPGTSWGMIRPLTVLRFARTHRFVSPFMGQNTTLVEISFPHTPQVLTLMKHMFEMLIVITVHDQLASRARFEHDHVRERVLDRGCRQLQVGQVIGITVLGTMKNASACLISVRTLAETSRKGMPDGVSGPTHSIPVSPSAQSLNLDLNLNVHVVQTSISSTHMFATVTMYRFVSELDSVVTAS